MTEQLKQDIKVWGLPPDGEAPNKYPLNICMMVAKELNEKETVVMFHYGERE